MKENFVLIFLISIGQVGDWKNHFTDAQSKALDDIYEEKLRGTGLEFDFE